MTVQRILVVDDEESIRKVVGYALAQEGFEVHTAEDVPGALAEFDRVSPALVILDVMLPGGSGFDVAREIRSRSATPIVMLSARSDEVDRVLGLELGADDYVVKPFSPRELVSRVRSVLRRAGGAPAEAPVVAGDVRIDTLSREVTVAGAPVHLTRTEYDILLHLARHAGTAFSRAALMRAMWDETPVGDERAIDVHMHNIREKIEADPKDPSHLLTVRGYGYRLAAGAESAADGGAGGPGPLTER